MNIPEPYASRYLAAMHAMQTGVAYLMEYEPDTQANAKHLRVGVNSAMVDSAAIANLLLKKGLITEAEYGEALATQAEAEAESYRKRLTKYLGDGVTLA